ncbi:MAG TPA: heat-inducible transcriptional repressor HrcA [Terriglobales bacterium]|nr:heat-inducible transcriptional repressor HrcA [Terriglobales bacterium]
MDARHREVLIAVIREYIDSAEPVGSRVLTKRYFPSLSPATIRNVMSDLEDMGYLAQPHTSAGRVPTDQAYRFYVESFPPAVTAAARAEALPARRSGIDGFMERASAHLSSTTRLTGVLLAPPLQHTRVARIDVIPLEGDRALAVVVTDAGWLTVRAITIDSPLRGADVREIGRELTRRFRDRSVSEILQSAERRDPLDPLWARAGGLLDQVFSLLGGRTLYVSGAMNMLDHPEFGDLESTRALLKMFEQKERLADLLASMADDPRVRVTIGEENHVAELRDCAVITCTYKYRDQVLGILGVVGPRRLPYPEIMSVVDETARHVTDALSRVRQDLYLPS